MLWCDNGAQADSLVYQAEKQVKELGDKAPAENKAKVEDKIKVCSMQQTIESGIGMHVTRLWSGLG